VAGELAAAIQGRAKAPKDLEIFSAPEGVSGTSAFKN
jgi:hypothetical protein